MSNFDEIRILIHQESIRKDALFFILCLCGKMVDMRKTAEALFTSFAERDFFAKNYLIENENVKKEGANFQKET